MKDFHQQELEKLNIFHKEKMIIILKAKKN